MERTALLSEAKTRRVSLDDAETKKFAAPSPRQLSEAQRLLDVATECVDSLFERPEIIDSNETRGLFLGGEPLVFLEVQVNPTASQGKLFWTLPYSILMDKRLTAPRYKKLLSRVQEALEVGGETVDPAFLGHVFAEDDHLIAPQ